MKVPRGKELHHKSPVSLRAVGPLRCGCSSEKQKPGCARASGYSGQLGQTGFSHVSIKAGNKKANPGKRFHRGRASCAWSVTYETFWFLFCSVLPGSAAINSKFALSGITLIPHFLHPTRVRTETERTEAKITQSPRGLG